MLLIVGEISAALCVVLLLVMQDANHDWFPPEISVSQYGLGRHGWIFTCWTVALALTVLATVAAGPVAGMVDTVRVYPWLLAGSVGVLVMGAIRTDAGGAQHSWHAKVHMIGSIVALITLPVGMVFALALAARLWRRAAMVLMVFSGAALLLVLASALGVRTPGMDAQHAWAFWQAIAVTVDMLFVVVFAMAGLDARHGLLPTSPPRLRPGDHSSAESLAQGADPNADPAGVLPVGLSPVRETRVPEGVEEFNS